MGYWTTREGLCGREESFAELFPLLGNKDAQNIVRNETAGLRHCALLAADPGACLECTLPENPYKGQAKHRFAYTQNAGLIHEALELYGEYDVGLVSNLLEMTPEEVAAITTVKQQERFHMARLQGEIMAAYLRG